jgi:SAM-dependent methyltransferase
MYHKLFKRLFPDFIKRYIDPVTYEIDTFVISVVNASGVGNRVLDAGAGECRFKPRLKNKSYVAIDAAWGDATWNYSQLDAVGALDRLPFTSGVFDCVICTQVLEHVQEPQLVLNELFRALKQGGVICLTAPQGWGVHQAPHDYFRFTNYALQYLLEKAGFESLSITPSCGYFGYLANRLTVLPKQLFWHIKKRWLRIILFPVELLSYFFFVLVFPLLLNAMDIIDRDRDFTLNYFVKGQKPQ